MNIQFKLIPLRSFVSKNKFSFITKVSLSVNNKLDFFLLFLFLTFLIIPGLFKIFFSGNFTGNAMKNIKNRNFKNLPVNNYLPPFSYYISFLRVFYFNYKKIKPVCNVAINFPLY